MLWQVFAYYSKISSSSQIVIVMQNVIVRGQPMLGRWYHIMVHTMHSWMRGGHVARWVHIRTWNGGKQAASTPRLVLWTKQQTIRETEQLSVRQRIRHWVERLSFRRQIRHCLSWTSVHRHDCLSVGKSPLSWTIVCPSTTRHRVERLSVNEFECVEDFLSVDCLSTNSPASVFRQRVGEFNLTKVSRQDVWTNLIWPKFPAKTCGRI